MESAQVEIARISDTISEVIAKDLREVVNLQLALTGGGLADVSLS